MTQYLLQHEFDDEPAYIVPADDPDAELVRIEPGNLVLARSILAFLNAERPSGPASPEYLDRFPPEARVHADRAYQDGYEDGGNEALSAMENARDLLQTAIDSHIYDDADDIPDDCPYTAAVEELSRIVDGRELTISPASAVAVRREIAYPKQDGGNSADADMRAALAVFSKWTVDVATIGELSDLESRLAAVGVSLQQVGAWGAGE